MECKNQELKQQDILTEEYFETLSKHELIEALKNTKMETFKYINKFLEAEEKWAFVNSLLKKLNAVKQKQEVCKTMCEGFLKLTNSQICYCCFFNQDNGSIEVSRLSHKAEFFNKKSLLNLIEKINTKCFNFIVKSIPLDIISEYFENLSDKKSIIIPLLSEKSIIGYLMLKKENNTFYKENYHFINIFPEHIVLKLENISLYQESEKQNKRKIEFLAGISHEFKTPLNAIIGFTEILQSSEQDSEKYKYINNILQSAKHLGTLIQDVLDVSKAQYKTLELNYSQFSTKDEINNILATFEPILNEKNIKLNYTLTDIKISSDIKRFRQLIYNLVSNAIKFNKQNGTINILTYVNEDKFFFEIEDTGDGISKKNYDKIFGFFSQVNRSQLKRQQGSGVGLAVCKMIIDAHNGEINFKSKLKYGSTFWFNLPLQVD